MDDGLDSKTIGLGMAWALSLSWRGLSLSHGGAVLGLCWNCVGTVLELCWKKEVTPIARGMVILRPCS